MIDTYNSKKATDQMPFNWKAKVHETGEGIDTGSLKLWDQI